ncbi:hypothetical protein [Xenorhabdus bovienii]|uniref:Uncharacterized protein n=1 Tax=Xenorhabdus bovienii str. kraussei Becker Underwood TaxID=1398204 RepID=A0A077PTS4_XENBV|nr:hypothetical protein [Xenorhabdus bovienii]CDH24438.1 hypothetical protein XBKB1_2790003 [Xenorhabdus bovienii str. kraussei Becker Underwood]
MSKSLMDTAVTWEITKHLLHDKHGNDIGIVITELDDMIDKTIHSAMHIAQMVSFEIKQKEESSHDQ